MKIPVIYIFLAVLLCAAACNKTPEVKKDDLKTVDVKKQEPQLFSGGGYKTYNIHLNKGMAVIEFEYRHVDSLRITIYDTNKSEIGTVKNSPQKPIDGLERITIPSDGNYILEIKGSGRWHINIW